MKHFKKLFSYLVALTMVLSLATFAGVNVHAEEDNTLTITNNGETAHTFELYQIFTGTKKSGDNTLGDVKWGSSVTQDGKDHFGDAATKAAELTKASDAEAFAKELVAGDNDNKKVYLSETAFQKSSAVKSGESYTFGATNKLPTGYYLVKDVDGSQTSSNSAYTEYICAVDGTTNLKTKLNVPTTIKKVQENKKNVNTNGKGTDSKMPKVQLGDHFNDVADYAVGENIPYELIGSLPTNYAKYTKGYYYQFTDTMDKGLTRNNDVKAYVLDSNGLNPKEIKSGFTVSDVAKGSDGKSTFTVTFDNLKTIKDENRNVINTNSDSKIKVIFTAKLNGDAVYGNPGNVNESYLSYSNNYNNKDNHGETPHDKVVVFTYELDTTKVDNKDTSKKLANAHFILLDSNGDNPKYLHQEKDRTGKIIANTWKESKNDATDFVSREDGLFVIKGLDDGTYYLKETQAPEGYNTDSTLHEIKINATTSNGQTWNGMTNALTTLKLGEHDDSGDAGTGVVKEQITNTKGSTLPSTGGMGTTLLYAAGGILVACAVAYVVLNKKHAK